MTKKDTDARFEDGADQPLQIIVADADDLQIVAALIQDAVFPAGEMRWQARQRRFAVLLNRFRWEDLPAARAQSRPAERVQALLVVNDVLGVASQGIAQGTTRGTSDVVLSLLDLAFEAGDDGAGRLVFTLSGDGAIALTVEALNITLKDVTRPYIAPSRAVPNHPE